MQHWMNVVYFSLVRGLLLVQNKKRIIEDTSVGEC